MSPTSKIFPSYSHSHSHSHSLLSLSLSSSNSVRHLCPTRNSQYLSRRWFTANCFVFGSLPNVWPETRLNTWMWRSLCLISLSLIFHLLYWQRRGGRLRGAWWTNDKRVHNEPSNMPTATSDEQVESIWRRIWKLWATCLLAHRYTRSYVSLFGRCRTLFGNVSPYLQLLLADCYNHKLWASSQVFVSRWKWSTSTRTRTRTRVREKEKRKKSSSNKIIMVVVPKEANRQQ